MTKPIQEIIPREIPSDLIPTINLFADTLEEIVNFGSHIMVWDTNPKSNGDENVAPVMLFRHFLDLIDSISILARHACGDTSKLLARGALETTLGIQYLFEKDTHNRAMAFLVADILNQIKTLKKLDIQRTEGLNLRKTMTNEFPSMDFKTMEEYDFNKMIATKEAIFNLPQFQAAYQEYLLLKQNKESNPKWYRFFNGPKNIELLARHLNQQTLYELLYRKWSGATHGSDIFLGKMTPRSDGGVDIVQLRYIRDVQEVVKFSMNLSITIFLTYVKNRIPDKTNEVSQWYTSIREKFFFLTENNLIKVI
jgi:hypothetical protein